MKLKDKGAIVTGGAKGIGLATVKRLLLEGCKINVWDIDEEALQKLESESKELKGRIFFHKCNVTNKNEVYGLAIVAKKEMGTVDILINNAGYMQGGNLNEHNNEIWEKTIDVNLTSVIYTTKAVLENMYERNSGHIVNISSASAYLGVPALSVYTATKWAVWGLTESMRFEAFNLGKKNVKFSSVHPSYIKTGMFEGAKLGFLGNLLIPLVKNHDVIAKAIVNDALKKEKTQVRRPRTLRLATLLRGILPDKVFQKVLVLNGVHKSMSNWKGTE